MSEGKPFEAVRDYGQQHMGWDETQHGDEAEQHVDHKAEALAWLEKDHLRIKRERSGIVSFDSFSSSEMVSRALVHATLALAEQNRLSNLIQYSSIIPGSPKRDSVLEQIERALGLTS